MPFDLRIGSNIMSVECSNAGVQPQVLRIGRSTYKGTFGMGGVVQRRIRILYASADSMRPCGSRTQRIFQRIFSGFFLKAFLVFIKIPEKSPAKSPQCPEQANSGNLQRNPRVSSTGNPRQLEAPSPSSSTILCAMMSEQHMKSS